MNKYRSKSFFAYEFDNFNLAISTSVPENTATFEFNTNGDSDFFWEKFACLLLAPDPSAVPEATTRSGDFVAGVLLSLTNTTTGRSLSNNPVPMANLGGYLQFAPEPMMWPKKSTIQIELTNETLFSGSGSAAYAVIQLSFMGTKAFY